MWLALCAIGLIAIYSTTHGSAQEFLLNSVQRNYERQFLWLGICSVGLIITLLVPVRTLIQFTPIIYCASIGLIILALLTGREVGGARSWIYFGPFGFQSSELAKVGTLLIVALALVPINNGHKRTVIPAIAAIGLLLLPAALIIMQNDTGTALIFISLIPVVLFWGGFSLTVVILMVIPAVTGYLTLLHWPTAVGFVVIMTLAHLFFTRNIPLTITAGSIAGGKIGFTIFALHKILRPHHVARILSFANPEAEEFRSGVGFHLLQSKAAIGSGGLLGQGFMQALKPRADISLNNRPTSFFLLLAKSGGLSDRSLSCSYSQA